MENAGTREEGIDPELDPKDDADGVLFVYLCVDGPEPDVCIAKTTKGLIVPMAFCEIDTAKQYVPAMKELAKKAQRPIQLRRYDFGRVVSNISVHNGMDD